MKHSIYWRDTEAFEPGPALRGDSECDVALIGGGYTALWTSHFLKKADPSLDISIVESEFVGAGASGHNDGFVTPTIGHSLRTVVDRFGAERAKAGYTAVGRSILELAIFCKKHGIDAQLEPNGFFLVATSPAQRKRLEGDIRLAEDIGGVAPPRLIEGPEIRTLIPSPLLCGAIAGGGALINPFKLARGLARVVTEQGVRIYEQTKAVEIQKVSDRHAVVTPNGRLLARQVVFATNAYQHQFPQFRRQVLPVWSYVLVSHPLTDGQLARIPWPGREGFVEARNFIVFARLTQDNRLLIGGGPAPYYFGRNMSDKHLCNNGLEAFLDRQAARFFPALDDLRWEYGYGGCIAMTRDLVPHVGCLGDNIFYAHGYCGNGIVMTQVAGKVLRDLLLEKESLYTKLFFVRQTQPMWPPQPVAYLAAKGVSLLLRAQDRSPSVVRWPRI